MSSEPDSEPIADVVPGRLLVLIDKLARHDSRIRRRAEGGVHGMRVTLRRLRSLLVSFGPLYDESAVPPLRAELKWIAGELGGARDAEVVRERVLGLATTEAERSLAERIAAQLEDTEASAVADGAEVLDSDRYSSALQDLTAFTTSIADAETGSPDDHDLRRRVRRDWKRLRRRARAVEATEGEAERQDALHEVRKAAKRLRYSSETLVEVHGDDAARLAKHARRVQSTLGDLQDSVVTRVRLRGLVEQPGWTAQEGFLLGVFHAREEAAAAEAEAAYVQAWSRLDRKRNRRWLR